MAEVSWNIFLEAMTLKSKLLIGEGGSCAFRSRPTAQMPRCEAVEHFPGIHPGVHVLLVSAREYY